MRVVIVGCGDDGARLARDLSVEGHKVSVIDPVVDSFARLGPTFRGEKIEGRAFNREALLRAGIERADGFAALTGSDNANIVAAVIARDIFHVPRVVARVLDPHRVEVYQRFGIYTVSPVVWVASQVKRLLTHVGLSSNFTFGSGQVEMVEITAPAYWAGRSVGQVVRPGEVAAAVIERKGRAFVPTQGTVLQEGDLLHLSVVASALGRLEAMLYP